MNPWYTFLRFGACALILLGCGYMIFSALEEFLELAILHKNRAAIGWAYLATACFFCYAAAMFVYPNFKYVTNVWPIPVPIEGWAWVWK